MTTRRKLLGWMASAPLVAVPVVETVAPAKGFASQYAANVAALSEQNERLKSMGHLSVYTGFDYVDFDDEYAD